MKLRIADNLTLAADFVTSTQAILAQKGKGKSYLVAVEAEELLEAHQVVVIIDPTDAHYGLRSSPNGRSTGYPIAVFGGDHGDVQLEPGGGVVLAEAIVRERFSVIVCTETLTKGEELRFIGDFLETLYRKNREAMHLFIDEADLFAPQNPFGGEMKTCGATDDIVRRGRKKGIGCTLVTQRASVLNKNVLSQADMLVALGCSHPLDLDAIEKWVRRNADPKLATEMMQSLPSLPRGEAWAWNPSANLFKRIAIRQRRTFDSGATPKAGEKKREPKILAPVDIARLGQSMADAVQRQKENDPKALKVKVAELTKALAARATSSTPAPATKLGKVKIVEKMVVKDAQIKRVEALIQKSEGAVADWLEVAQRAAASLPALLDRVSAQATAFREEAALLRTALAKATADVLTPLTTRDVGAALKAGAAERAHAERPNRVVRGPQLALPTTEGAFSRLERAIMIALAQHPDGLTRKQVLVFTGYANSGTVGAAFAKLIAGGHAESRNGQLAITASGVSVLGGYEPLPLGDELRASLLHGNSSLSALEKEILGNVCAAYPNVIDRTTARGKYANSGTVGAAFAKLITMGYVHKAPGGTRAAEELFS
jgi:hypothetical protein